MTLQRFNYIILFLLFTASSCKRESVNAPTSLSNGVYITNEGNFMSGNGDVTFYNPDTKLTNTEIYKAANGFSLGDVVQSMLIRDSIAYIIVNNSEKLEVVNLEDFRKKATINLIGSSPRFFAFANDSLAIVTELYAKKLWIVNSTNNSFSRYITVPGWTEHIVNVSGNIFATCRNNPGTGNNINKLLVISPSSITIQNSIDLPGTPICMASGNNCLYVSCDGVSGNNATLVSINTTSLQIETLYTFDSNQAATALSFDDNLNRLYLLRQNLYRYNFSNQSLETIFSAGGRNLYAIGADKTDHNIYVSDAKDYVQRSEIIRLDTNGNLIHSFYAGIISGSFNFKHE